MNTRQRLLGLSSVALLVLAGCTSAYYGAMEKFGIEKRDILTDRVDDARDAQEDAKEQFADALEQYRAVVNVDGGGLEKFYNRLNSEFEKSESRAQAVTDRIDSIEAVADDLFEEWEGEIGEYTDPDLRRRSQALLAETRQDYSTMLSAMRRAEASMEPVLDLFRDQVLFLRHNLNARAVGALETELTSIDAATSTAIAEMERSIAEANRFIRSMS